MCTCGTDVICRGTSYDELPDEIILERKTEYTTHRLPFNKEVLHHGGYCANSNTMLADRLIHARLKSIYHTLSK